MFRPIISPFFRSTWLCLQLLLWYTDVRTSAYNTKSCNIYIYICVCVCVCVCVYLYMRTLISRTVTVSVCKTVNEPTQHHTAFHYNSWLRWAAMNLRLQTTCHPFLFFRCPTSFQRPSVVAAFCVHSVECVEGVWDEEEFDIYRADEG
jgi:hypothetical protein